MGVPSVLIVHFDRKTQRTIHRVLAVTGYQVDVADDLQHAVQLIADRAPMLAVVDATAVLAPAGEALFAAAAARGTEICLTLLGAPSLAHVPRLLGHGAITNLLVHPMPVLAEELTITAQKLIRRDVFGAEKYLLWGTELHATTLTRSSQRAELVAHIGEIVRARGQSARVASMAMLVTDELLSNAVHNAPRDADGQPYRKELPRDHELDLDGRHQVRLRFGCDARYFAIEVNDDWGTLDRATILGALARTDVRQSGGGAGMGLSLAYRSCDHLVFDLAPSRRTEIIALVDVRYPATERMPASSYNVFVEATAR